MSRSNRKSKQFRAMEASMPDYGQYAGIGAPSAVGGRLRVEVKPGREADFMVFLAAQGDAGSRRLRAKATEATWDRELRSWVRKRLARGIDVPDSIDHRWDAA